MSWTSSDTWLVITALAGIATIVVLISGFKVTHSWR